MGAIREQGHTPPKASWVNRIMIGLLRSPLSRLVDGGLMLLTVTGRRTGRSYTFPVQYVADGRMLWVYAGGSDAKTWWRNLIGGAEVEVLLRRRPYRAPAIASTHRGAPELVEDGLRRYLDRFPSTGRRLGIATGNRLAFEQAVADTVIVRIELSDATESPQRSSVQDAGRGADQGEG